VRNAHVQPQGFLGVGVAAAPHVAPQQQQKEFCDYADEDDDAISVWKDVEGLGRVYVSVLNGDHGEYYICHPYRPVE